MICINFLINHYNISFNLMEVKNLNLYTQNHNQYKNVVLMVGQNRDEIKRLITYRKSWEKGIQV